MSTRLPLLHLWGEEEANTSPSHTCRQDLGICRTMWFGNESVMQVTVNCKLSWFLSKDTPWKTASCHPRSRWEEYHFVCGIWGQHNVPSSFRRHFTQLYWTMTGIRKEQISVRPAVPSKRFGPPVCSRSRKACMRKIGHLSEWNPTNGESYEVEVFSRHNP